MSAVALFLVPFIAAGAAVIGALVADMLALPRTGVWLSAGLLVAGGAVALGLGWTADPASVVGSIGVGGAASTVPGVVFLLAAAAIVAGAGEGKAGATQAALVAMASFGAALAAVSRDLTTLLIGVEIAATAAYALVSRGRRNVAHESAMKYFVQGAAATGLLVMGIAVVVSGIGSDGTYRAVAQALASGASRQAAALGLVAITAALAFKVGAAPLHSWAPDAYDSSHPAAASALAGPVKLGMLTALAVFVASIAQAGAQSGSPFGLVGREAFVLPGVLAIVSVILGSTVALQTRSYTRMLAYAGVAQVGYGLIAIASLNPSGAFVFGVTYAVASTATFAAAAAFPRQVPEWDGTVEGLRGTAQRSPLLAAAVTVSLMSLAGIPPLFGFWGKLQAFGAAVSAAVGFNQGGATGFAVWFGFLALVGVAGSIVSLGYYGAVVRALYADAPSGLTDVATADDAESPAGLGAAGWTVVGLAALVLALGLLPLIFGIPATVSGFLLR